jgi:Ran GTPase-activating protein (RanGAP) involved in mRNA processing and transport
MQTIVDYLGCRVVAMPLLPVRKDTLIHGSADAGKTLMTEVSEVEWLLEQAALQFFLAMHFVAGKQICTAGDVEVHKFENSDHYFFIDLARVFPPQCPKTSNDRFIGRENPGTQMFFRLFRPEFLIVVRNLPEETGISEGISSDVFSRWGIADADHLNQVASRITEFLTDKHVKNVAGKLSIRDLTSLRMSTTSASVSSFFHAKGINIRFLGVVAHFSSPEVCLFLCINIVVRTLKNVMRQLMRSQTTFSGAADIVCEYINSCLHISRTRSFSYLLENTGLSAEIKTRFGQKAVEHLINTTFDHGLLLNCFLEALQECGLVLEHKISSEMEKSSSKDLLISPKDLFCSVTLVSKMVCFERQLCEEMDLKADRLMVMGLVQSSLKLRQECFDKLSVLRVKLITSVTEIESLLLKQRIILESSSENFALSDEILECPFSNIDVQSIVNSLFALRCMNESHGQLIGKLFAHSQTFGLKIVLMILARVFKLQVSFHFSEENVDVSSFSYGERRIMSFLFNIFQIPSPGLLVLDGGSSQFSPLQSIFEVVEQLEIERFNTSSHLPLLLPPPIWLNLFAQNIHPIFEDCVPNFVSLPKLIFHLVFQTCVTPKLNLPVGNHDLVGFDLLLLLWDKVLDINGVDAEVQTSNEFAWKAWRSFIMEPDFSEVFISSRHVQEFLSLYNWASKISTSVFESWSLEWFSFPLPSNLNFNAASIQSAGAQSISEAGLFDLRKLNLAQNEIGIEGAARISDAGWKTLEELNISSNNLGIDGINAISKAGWKQLQVIGVSYNNLGAGGAEGIAQAEWTQLRTIDISSNNICAEGASFIARAEWGEIQSLNISKNNICSEGARSVAQANWSQIQNVNISSNFICAAGFQSICQVWSLLLSLDVSDNTIGDDGADYIAQAKWAHLQELKISSNKIGPDGALSIAKAGWIHLQSLDVSHNRIGAEGAASLAQAGWKELQSLNISSNGIGPKGASNISQGVWENLVSLDISDNRICPEGAASISQAGWTQLRTINLKGNQICKEGAASLSQAGWSHLQSLNISSNDILGEGASSIAFAGWNNLQTLDISSNRIGDSGAASIAQAEWAKLQTLDVSNNDMSDDGAASLSQAGWTMIRSLNISLNYRIGDNGVASLSQAGWKQIRSLNISHLKVGPVGLRSMADAKWTQIRTFKARGISMGNEGAAIISRAGWSRLQELHVLACKISEEGAASFSRAGWAHLQVLDISQNTIGGAGALSLTQPGWIQLRSLNISRNELALRGAQNISKGKWPHLQELDISSNNIGYDGAAAIAQAGWKNLKVLDASSNEIGGGAKHFAQAGWTQLEELRLSHNDIDAKDVGHFKSDDWGRLKKLEIDDNNLGSNGAVSLANKGWTQIRSISVSNNSIGDIGLASLAAAGWSQLREICLWNNNISGAGTKSIVEANWRQAERISLYGNKIEEEAASELSDTYPHCSVET